MIHPGNLAGQGPLGLKAPKPEAKGLTRASAIKAKPRKARAGRLLDGRTWDQMPGGQMLDLPTKALSIRQPWADAIIWLGKDIENRSWATNFRGMVCIHAAKKWGRAEKLNVGFVENLTATQLEAEPHLGCIIGVAEIVDCVTTSESRWFSGPYGFVLRNARPVDFIPVKGALGFFDWRKRLEAHNA